MSNETPAARAKRLARAREWQRAHPFYQSERDWRKRGILNGEGAPFSVSDYQHLYAAQGGVCALCGVSEGDSTGRRLSVDHDHRTGRVRGLLCGVCNHRTIGGIERVGVERVWAYLNAPLPR